MGYRYLQLTTTSIVFWAACAAFMAITVLSISSAKSSLSAVGIFVAGHPFLTFKLTRSYDH